MAKHTFYATKDIHPAGQAIGKHLKPVVNRGEVLLTIDTPIELDRAIAAVTNGTASADKPKDEKSAGAAPAGK